MNTGETVFKSSTPPGASGKDSPSEVPSLVLLKPGSDRSPIFMAPGIGDTASALSRLASQIETSHPIYGMQAKGFDGIAEPLDRIDEMAAFQVEAIRRLQPHGPYFLVGYSLGGLVTVEMARFLSGAGETIGLLALVDAYPHRRYASLGIRTRLLMRLAGTRIAALLKKTSQSEPKAKVPPRVRERQDRALENYRPQSYAGKVKFVKANVSSFLPDDPEGFWRSRVHDLEVVTVPGNHLEMLTTHAQEVGAVLSNCLAEAGAN